MAGAPTPVIIVNENALRAGGFTDSGRTRYLDTVTDYAAELKKRAEGYADVDKAPNLAREVTHDHVRQAAVALAGRREPISKWTIVGQVFEYLATAATGYSVEHLNTVPGIIEFGLSLSLAVILIVARLIYSGR